VLGLYPADKYRTSAEDVVTGLASVCRARPVAAIDLVRQFAFAYLTCNGDAHAKNFSVVRADTDEWRVTPAYDLPSSYPYGDTTLALTVNGRRREDVGRADFVALGAAAGLPERAVNRALDDLCDRVDLWLGGVSELPFDEGVLRKLQRSIEYRRERLSATRPGG
jgi:serine/threonine-protein kinase HipA